MEAGSGLGPGPGHGPAADVAPGSVAEPGPSPAPEPSPVLTPERAPVTDSGPMPAPERAPVTDPGPMPAPERAPVVDSDPLPVPDASPVPVGTEPAPDPDSDPDVEPLPRGAFRCRLCQVTAANRPSLAEHLRGKRHRRLGALRWQRRQQELRSLFVSGFPRGTSAPELAAYFGNYGAVAGVVMDKEKGAYAIVELQDSSGRQRALAEPQHCLAGSRLRVRPREPKGFGWGRGKDPARPPQQDPLGPEGLQQKLWQEPDVDAQMVLLVQLLELSQAERRLRDLLVALFQEVFSEFFPGCSVLPFGSSVNSFSTHGCDLDLFLDLEPTQSLQASLPGSSPALGLSDSLLSDLDLASTPGPELLELVGSVLRRCVPGVGSVRPVPGARRPVVKFCHKQSGLAGDISLDNRLAVLNTSFLQLCSQADLRVRPLVYTIRLWAKQQGLAGKPSGGGSLLTNYALTLLVVFFLQSCSPPVLPSLEQLQEMAGPQDRAVVSGWDCSFPRDASALQPSTNTQPPSSLLAEFFHLFGDLDVATQLLSLRRGRALPLLPVPEGFKPGPFNLQDPFELSHNVAANVSQRSAGRFRCCCQAAAKFCRSLQYRQKSTKGRAWGVTRLFQPGAVEPGASSSSSSGVFLIPIPLEPDPGGGSRGGASRFEEVCSAVAFVLREVLRCGCSPGIPPQAAGKEAEGAAAAATAASPEEPSVGSKRRSPAAANGSAAKRPRGGSTEASWSCAVWHRVWTGRRRLRRQLRGDGAGTGTDGDDSLELEKKVSEAISRQDDSPEPEQPLLSFQASVRPAGARRVLLRLLPADPGPLFRDFFHFLRSFLPLAVRRRLGQGPGSGEEGGLDGESEEGEEEEREFASS